MNLSYAERRISRDHVKIWTEPFGSHKNPAIIFIVGAGTKRNFKQWMNFLTN